MCLRVCLGRWSARMFHHWWECVRRKTHGKCWASCHWVTAAPLSPVGHSRQETPPVRTLLNLHHLSSQLPVSLLLRRSGVLMEREGISNWERTSFTCRVSGSRYRCSSWATSNDYLRVLFGNHFVPSHLKYPPFPFIYRYLWDIICWGILVDNI